MTYIIEVGPNLAKLVTGTITGLCIFYVLCRIILGGSHE
jgi:hypothetical protein